MSLERGHPRVKPVHLTVNRVASPGDHPLPDEESLIGAAAGLVSPPTICLEIMALVRSPSSTASDFARLVSKDVNLAARVLRIVNSAYYGQRRQVETLDRAVMLLGTRDLANIIVAIAAVRSFSRLGAGLVSIDAFWRHGIFVALTARRLARHFEVSEAERLFLGGLLHDVGSAVLYAGTPQLVDWALSAGAPDSGALAGAERELLGFDHGTLGGRLLESWELPETIVRAVAGHHAPGRRNEPHSDTALLELADGLAASSEVGAFGVPSAAPEQVPHIVAELAGDGLTPAAAGELLDAVEREFAETTEALSA